jgi:ferric-dicitrate binding protein FerR (iron transport regulator)
MNKEDNNKYLDYVANILSQNATNEDFDSIKEDIKNDIENITLFKEYANVWNSCSLLDKTTPEEEIDKSYNKIKEKLKIHPKEIILESKQKNIFREVLKIASIFILAFALGATGYYFFNQNSLKKEKIVYNEINVPYGAKSNITLPDGTLVWLNAGSKLRYPKNFDRINRDVYLDGEGYFEVVKNKDLEFVVHTDEVDVKAIRTTFNVKSYPDEGIIETTLIEGLVKVVKKGSNTKRYAPVYLKPNQKVTFQKDNFKQVNLNTKKEIKENRLHTKEDANLNKKIENKKAAKVLITEKIKPEIYTSWKDNRWIIESEVLGSLAKKLERRYDITIKFEDEKLKTFIFTGTLKNDPLEQVLKAMELTAPLKTSVQGKEVFFESNKKSVIYQNHIKKIKKRT